MGDEKTWTRDNAQLDMRAIPIEGPSSPCCEEFCSENVHKKISVLMDGPHCYSGVSGLLRP